MLGSAIIPGGLWSGSMVARIVLRSGTITTIRARTDDGGMVTIPTNIITAEADSMLTAPLGSIKGHTISLLDQVDMRGNPAPQGRIRQLCDPPHDQERQPEVHG
jgi:hypothetical protein